MLKTFFLNLGIFFLIFKSFDLFASVLTPHANDIKAIIFDCDGVLVDTEYLKFLAWKKALASVDRGLSVEEYQKVAGHSSKKIHEILQEMKNLDIPEEVIHLRRVIYQELQVQGVPPMHETIEFARYLSQNKSILGIKLGLASSASKNEILLNLKHIGLEHEFDLIISGSDDLEDYVDSDGKNKPKPYIYLEASKRLNISPKHCLVFEDTEAGIEAATTAGMITVAIPNWMTKAQNFSKANTVINSISELPIEISKRLGYDAI
jgi:beta-phosphoglucomutase